MTVSDKFISEDFSQSYETRIYFSQSSSNFDTYITFMLQFFIPRKYECIIQKLNVVEVFYGLVQATSCDDLSHIMSAYFLKINGSLELIYYLQHAELSPFKMSFTKKWLFFAKKIPFGISKDMFQIVLTQVISD